LDETYERILEEIEKPNRDHAHRLLQCLVAAIRPLLVEELAEVLAIDSNVEGVPRLNPRWRWEDQEQSLLSSCSNLITIVNLDGSRIVQFSHHSVREFLTSSRLAMCSGDHISNYHIALQPAHTTLAQACVSVLLQLDDRVVTDDINNSSPLAQYAARHWVSHAQFGHVSSRIKGMEYLFDKDRPHFGSWVRLYNADNKPDANSIFAMFTSFRSGAVPLYYAALCGFRDVSKHIIDRYPQDVNARGGYYVTPLVAALAGRHFDTAQLLCIHGADPNVRCYDGKTPLHAAVQSGDLEVVQKLIEYNADINARNVVGWTTLHIASHLNQPNMGVIQLLLENGIDIDARAKDDSTALHAASAYGTIEVVRFLLERGASAEIRDNQGRTAHQIVSRTRDKAVKSKLLKGISMSVDTRFQPPRTLEKQ
jgi:ankyrin repeat protein